MELKAIQGESSAHDKIVAEAEVIRSMIGREDEVLNTRLTWCGTIQGLLVTALAFAWKDAPSSFTYVLAGVGTYVAVSTLYATRTAVATMHELTKWFTKRARKDYDGPPVIGHGTERWKFTLLRPSLGLPIAFMVMWVGISIVRWQSPATIQPPPNPAGQGTNATATSQIP